MKPSSLLLTASPFLLATVVYATPAAGTSVLADFSGRVPPEWPADMTAPVAVPLDAARPLHGHLRRTSRAVSRVPLPEALATAKFRTASLQVEGWDAPRDVVVQCEPADEVAGTPARGFFLCKLAPEDRGRAVRLWVKGNATEPPPADTPYESRLDDPVLTLRTATGGREVLSYWHGRPESGKPLPLTSFIHPLMGLDGELLTALRPADHIHHRGVYWAWVRHERDGKNIGDWWHPTNIHAEPESLSFADGPVFSRFTARHHWLHGTGDNKPPQRFVDEQLVCRVFETSEHGRAIDVDLTLTARVPGIRFGGTLEKGKGYGGFTFRYSDVREAVVEADGQRIERDLNQVRARWMDLNGHFRAESGGPAASRSGAAILVHPSHPDLPPEWIVRGPAAASQGRSYAVLNVSYPGMNLLELAPDEPLQLRYRLWIHRGDAGQGRVDENYRAYAASDWDWKAPPLREVSNPQERRPRRDGRGQKPAPAAEVEPQR